MSANNERHQRAMDNFLQDVYSIHGNKILVLDSYTTNKTKVNVLCNNCGHIWSTRPNDLKSGYGCPACAHMASNRKAAETFIADITSVHGDSLLVLSPYINARTKVNCICTSCNNQWSTTPTLLKRGHSCPACAKLNNQFNKRVLIDEPILLYYVYFSEYNLWKIGCTKYNAETRFIKENTNVTTIYSELFQFGGSAYILEGYLLRQFREFKYRGANIISRGNTELLIQEINFKEALEQAKIELGITNGS